MPASPIELKNSLPDLDMNQGQRRSSARQASKHCGDTTRQTAKLDGLRWQSIDQYASATNMHL